MLYRSAQRRRWLTSASALIFANVIAVSAAHAQESESVAESETVTATEPQGGTDIVVTGSRIRGSSDTQSPAPVAVVSGESVSEKGFAQVGEVLNELPSNTPVRTGQGPTLSNGQAVAGQDYPNLFNLGPARTLSLLNGRRMPPTTSGLGDEATDVNIIPVGLLSHIDVVQGGGAAVYGSGAIGGVINYVLKDKFEGLDLTAQYRTDANAYRALSLRGVAGINFADGRGNIAVEIDYSKTSNLTFADRLGEYAGIAVPNPAPGAGTNGVPATVFLKDASFLTDTNGAIVTTNNILAAFQFSTLTVGGKQLTIDSNGNTVPKFLGTPFPTSPIFFSGSDTPFVRLRTTSLVAPVERKVATLIGHFDITDNIRLSGEFLAAQTEVRDPNFGILLSESIGIYAPTFPNLAPIPFTRNNPYLSQSTIAQLSALNPGFAAGDPLYISKTFINQSAKMKEGRFGTDTYRGLVALSGDFNIGERKLYWEASYSHAQVKQKVESYAFIYPNFRNAANAVRNSAGQIVCAINVPAVTDPNCQPLNIFGTDPIPAATEAYLYGRTGNNVSRVLGNVKNKFDNILLNTNGDLVRLPGGQAKFSLTYEHRSASANFDTLPGDQAGIFFTGFPTASSSGKYRTDEFAAELDVPLVGEDFTLPLIQELSVNGSFRYISNSLAGKDNVWAAGLRWKVIDGLQFRGTRSRNFRAPSINQVAAPQSTGIVTATHPCSSTAITSGPAPSVRAANCLALFTANPTYGLDQLPGGAANTPQNRLSNFVGTLVSSTIVTTGGNPNLENETADTLTAGVVVRPSFIPGLVISADILRLKIKNGLTLFATDQFAAACFDASPQPQDFCGAFSFRADGQFATGRSTTVNAANSVLHAEIYNIDYRLGLNQISSSLPGSLNLVLQATHNTLATTTFAGTTTRTDGTINLPEWVVRFDARYKSGPFGLNYSLNYLPSSLLTYTSTVENSTDGVARVASNARHDISMEYEFDDKLTLRFGVNDITNRRTSFPTTTYGDILGRTAFISANLRY
jgi:outer membrane receptor protein involved in Fe transport